MKCQSLSIARFLSFPVGLSSPPWPSWIYFWFHTSSCSANSQKHLSDDTVTCLSLSYALLLAAQKLFPLVWVIKINIWCCSIQTLLQSCTPSTPRSFLIHLEWKIFHAEIYWDLKSPKCNQLPFWWMRPDFTSRTSPITHHKSIRAVIKNPFYIFGLAKHTQKKTRSGAQRF